MRGTVTPVTTLTTAAELALTPSMFESWLADIPTSVVADCSTTDAVVATTEEASGAASGMVRRTSRPMLPAVITRSSTKHAGSRQPRTCWKMARRPSFAASKDVISHESMTPKVTIVDATGNTTSPDATGETGG